MKSDEFSAQLRRVQESSLHDLKLQFGQDWKTVGQDLVQVTATRSPKAIEAFVLAYRSEAQGAHKRLARDRRNPVLAREALASAVQARMAHLAVDEILFAAATGKTSGRVRFNLWSGLLIQKLFFAGADLVRKPVSLRAFRWLWPLVRQKRLLMPLVQPRGIYCFYTRELVQQLAVIIGNRDCLELAAGDGTLARFLSEAGVGVRATDNRSWSQYIQYPQDVEALEAGTALERYQPRAVICSFPPPQNEFEKRVFLTPSVELYIVLTTRHRFAAGDWSAYAAQTQFTCTDDSDLAKLLLPPEIDPAVLVFARKNVPAN